MEEPTVGRIVYYVPFADESGTCPIRPALIIGVHSQQRVDLQVFRTAENAMKNCSPTYLIEKCLRDENERGNTWHFPKRQIPVTST